MKCLLVLMLISILPQKGFALTKLELFPGDTATVYAQEDVQVSCKTYSSHDSATPPGACKVEHIGDFFVVYIGQQQWGVFKTRQTADQKMAKLLSGGFCL